MNNSTVGGPFIRVGLIKRFDTLMEAFNYISIIRWIQLIGGHFFLLGKLNAYEDLNCFSIKYEMNKIYLKISFEVAKMKMKLQK